MLSGLYAYVQAPLAHVAASTPAVCNDKAANNLPISAPCASPLPQVKANNGEIHAALILAFGIIGAVALLIIVIAGFQFIVSQGDPQKVAGAKNAIMYAAAGLGLAILAITIVGFVAGTLG